MSNGCPFHKQTPAPAPATGEAEIPSYTSSQVNKLRRDLEALAPAVAWVDEFVKQANPKLGRSGVVCPFVPEATRQDMLQYFVLDVTLPAAIRPTATESDYAALIEPSVLKLCRQFVAGRVTDTRTRLLQAYLIVFRGLDLELERASILIENIQKKLKPRFVEEGLMLGEFHPYSNAAGLRNEEFRPLRSPVPLLSFRNMVEIDFVFLSRKYDPAPLRIHFLKCYLQHMGPELGAVARIRAEVALREAEEELQTQGSLEREVFWQDYDLSPGASLESLR